MNGVNSIEALEHASSPARSLWLSSVNPPRGRGDSFFRVSGRRREREKESSPAFCEFSRAWGCTVPRNQDVIGGNKRGRREFNVALLLLLLLPSNKGCFLDFVSSSLREGDPRWMGVMIMNEACLEKRDASCVLIQDARRDTRRMITRDEKCLIRCVFRKEMVWWVGVEERRKSFFPFVPLEGPLSRPAPSKFFSVLYKTGTLKK